MNTYKYIISTVSTGGFDAEIQVQLYIDDVLLGTFPMPYGTYSSKWKVFHDFFRIGYNTVTSLNWTCEFLDDMDGHVTGEQISWMYSATQNLTLTVQTERPSVEQSMYNISMDADNYTDPDGYSYVTSASSYYQASRKQAFKPFNQLTYWGEDDCWHSSSGVPQWLKIHLPQPVMILGMTLHSRLNYTNHPTELTLQGSNDDETWTDIHTINWNDSDTGVDVTIDASEYNDLYSFFRWYCTKNTSFSNYSAFGQIKFTDVSVIPINKKYLIESEGSFYTVQNDSLVELTGVTTLTAQDFLDSGCDDIPSSLLLSLDDPEVFYWTDVDSIRSLTATETATPFPQTLESADYDMTHPSIVGIEKVTAVASSDVTFAVSFNSGSTWKIYTGSDWGTLSEGDTGMSATTMNAISSEAWNTQAVTGTIKFRVTLPSLQSTLISLVVDYLNS